MDRSLIWVFGNAVQDVTVEVDIDTLIRDNASLIDSIALKDTALLKKGTLFTTQFNGQALGVELDLGKLGFAPEEPPQKQLYSLSPGEKYTLTGRVENLADRPDWLGRRDDLKVHCEDISWGGGGINVCRFLRALAPSDRMLEIRYTDYAMKNFFAGMVKSLESDLRKGLRLPEPSIGINDIDKRIDDFMETHMYEGEQLIAKISRTLAEHSPERSLEVFLASLSIRPLLFRPRRPVYQRNWVFSNLRNAERSTHDKIICRGQTPSEAELHVTPNALENFLKKGESDHVGAIVLNSIKHKALFHAAYKLYRRIEKKRESEECRDFVGVLAMTKAMQDFVPDMIDIAKKENEGRFPPFILIFNETEAVSFAKKLGRSVAPIIRGTGDLPNVLHFAQVIDAIRSHFGPRLPRIYVTVGARGSLGFDGGSNQIIHVSYYSRQGDVLFDTNACGDAYCAAITLLEWQARCRKGYAAPKHTEDEMRDFMAVATAAAYCKARDRRGRIDAKTIRGLLEDTYLGSGSVGTVDQILSKNWDPWVDREGRVHRPPDAEFCGVKDYLAELLLTKADAAAAVPA